MNHFPTKLGAAGCALALSLFCGCGEPSNEGTSGGSQKPAAPQVVVPAEQQQFVGVVAPFIQKYEAAPNKLKKSALRAERKNALTDALKSLEFNGWVGTLKTMETTSKGNAHVQIELRGAPITIMNNNNEVSAALGDKTLISMKSELFKTISKLSEGQRVRVSGNFIKGGKDFIEELNLTEDGAMTEPEFSVKFTKVEKY